MKDHIRKFAYFTLLFVFGLALLCADTWAAPLTQIPPAKAAPKETTMPPSPIHEQTVNPRNPLTPEEVRVLLHKGTEAPYSGEYVHTTSAGVYYCKRCNSPLFRSDDKFDSSCGWPSFDSEIPEAVRRIPDADGQRTEIVCTNCGGHLGHVFEGEGFTDKNTRHCVNSVSLRFVPADSASNPTPAPTDSPASAPAVLSKAYFAGGCFWGVEDSFQKLPGVVTVISGYSGGTLANPRYEDVSTGRSGHAETVEVLFDPAKISYESLARLFFEIHDPTQRDRQGPDVGSQYRSAVFYTDAGQQKIVESLIALLQTKGWDVVTQVAPVGAFFPAEDYHQDFTARTGRGACHLKVPRFEQGPAPRRGIF